MRKRHIIKFFLNILITCAIIAGLSGLASGQSKFENKSSFQDNSESRKLIVE